MSLTASQSTPAIDTAINYPNSTLYQLQPSFHTQSTEPELTARARRAGEEFYWTTPEFMFVSLFGSGRVHLDQYVAIYIRCSVRACESQSAPRDGVKGAQNLDLRVSATTPPKWTITPLFYSRSTDLPVLRGRRSVAGH